ncbi:MAG: UDP-N-acetylmuramoyl-L-alanine--D-glutamate ligase [Deltaproteobacteria bacterium]|nr:UDP-N-acetylmuramoyl-L-alanine--D-glutamate ligase [Deltaproteobacteria bacterium]
MDALNQIRRLLEGKRLLILGLGKEGGSSYRLLRRLFPGRRLGVADKDPDNPAIPRLREDPDADLYVGPDYLSSLENYDLLLKTPGIPYSTPGLARHLHKITSQTDLFLKACPGTVVGITGTKGKSTCSTLIHALLSSYHPDVHLIGNIGIPALDILEKLGPRSLVVFELSSHQLANVTAGPDISVLLNLYVEHMDYYGNMDAYTQAKSNIVRNASSNKRLIYNGSFEPFVHIAQNTKAISIAYAPEDIEARPCWVEDGRIYFEEGEEIEEVIPVADLPLPGTFNLNNVIPAIIVAKLLGVPTPDIRTALRRFKPLEHRLQRVGLFRGIEFYNDSISTIPECAVAALEHFDGRVGSLIAGGHDRGGVDYHPLAGCIVRRRPDALILFPETGKAILQAYRSENTDSQDEIPSFFAENMEQAVRIAFEKTPRGKACLLSPASPSFGLFKNYEDRGASFRAWAVKIADELNGREAEHVDSGPLPEGRGGSD